MSDASVPRSWLGHRSWNLNETDIPGPYTWQSTDRLVDDVRRWVKKPSRNYGWILVGDESVKQTAKQFASRESVSPELRPMLEVTYSLPE